MNFFGYRCPACGAEYQDMVENGHTRLVHSGLTGSQDPAPLPTEQCRRCHDYVVFLPCGHCGPEVYDECYACRKNLPGTIAQRSKPTKTACYCNYCVVPSLAGSTRANVRLTEHQKKEIMDALLLGFKSDELGLLTKTKLDLDLETIASEKLDRTAVVLRLFEWAERAGSIERLINAAVEERPDNLDLQRLARSAKEWFAA